MTRYSILCAAQHPFQINLEIDIFRSASSRVRWTRKSTLILNVFPSHSSAPSRWCFPPFYSTVQVRVTTTTQSAEEKKKKRKEEDDIAVLECRSFFCAGCITVTMGLQLQNAFTEVLLVHCFVFSPLKPQKSSWMLFSRCSRLHFIPIAQGKG